MFGHQDDKKKDDEQDKVVAPDGSAPAADAPDAGTPPQDNQAVQIDDAGQLTEDPSGGSDTVPATDTNDDNAWQHPGAPLREDDEKDKSKDKKEDQGPGPIKDIIGENAGPDFKPPHHHAGNDDHAADNTPHELIDIKQKALHELMPLADKLDQTPEDKFRTLMMMIQASDDQGLVKAAYEAAHKIKDDKVRAQALLDVVNEINYFTQPAEN